LTGADDMLGGPDPGELLARATALAEQVPADPAALPAEARGRAAVLLREAIACLDAVLRCVPAGADRVPDGAFRSAAGRAIRDRRPGAFDVAMLQAQRNALARLLGQAEAVASAETVRLSATMADLARPLLETLAQAPEVFLATVRPRSGDAARAFVPEVAAAAAQAYDTLWRDLKPPRPEAAQTELRIIAAPAGLLASDNAFSAGFPHRVSGDRRTAPATPCLAALAVRSPRRAGRSCARRAGMARRPLDLVSAAAPRHYRSTPAQGDCPAMIKLLELLE
jgi:hypothetical protein